MTSPELEGAKFAPWAQKRGLAMELFPCITMTLALGSAESSLMGDVVAMATGSKPGRSAWPSVMDQDQEGDFRYFANLNQSRGPVRQTFPDTTLITMDPGLAKCSHMGAVELIATISEL